MHRNIKRWYYASAAAITAMAALALLAAAHVPQSFYHA